MAVCSFSQVKLKWRTDLRLVTWWLPYPDESRRGDVQHTTTSVAPSVAGE
jgi:hypothetical protein